MTSLCSQWVYEVTEWKSCTYYSVRNLLLESGCSSSSNRTNILSVWTHCGCFPCAAVPRILPDQVCIYFVFLSSIIPTLEFSAFFSFRMARITGIPSLYKTRNALLLIFSFWTAFTAITRVTDYWHYPTDVLGISSATLNFLSPLHLLFERTGLPKFCTGTVSLCSRICLSPLLYLGGIALAAFCVLPTFGWQWRTYEDVYGPRNLERGRPHFEWFPRLRLGLVSVFCVVLQGRSVLFLYYYFLHSYSVMLLLSSVILR